MSPRTRQSGKRAAAAPSPPAEAPTPRRAALFAGRILLWLVPVAVVWTLVTPIYNGFLIQAGENLVHLFESGDVTRLLRSDEHYVAIRRTDFPVGSDVVGSLRATDLHFPLILLGALFLATPVPWKERLWNLAVALVATVVFHVVLTAFWVQFTYATQLGSWSLEHYGAFARNFWGLGKHLLDLPVKLAWPFALWAAFYLQSWLPPPAPAEAASA